MKEPQRIGHGDGLSSYQKWIADQATKKQEEAQIRPLTESLNDSDSENKTKETSK